jgi:hypothetical protein
MLASKWSVEGDELWVPLWIRRGGVSFVWVRGRGEGHADADSRFH